MIDLECAFCGQHDDQAVDDVFVFGRKRNIAICGACVQEAMRAVAKWAAGKIEYESWARE